MQNKFVNPLIELADEYDITGTHVPYGFAAEYLNSKGMLDYAYFTRKHKVYGATKDFGKAVREVFGDITFTYDEPSEVITKEEFLKLYEFGKFPSVLRWVSHVASETGKVIRKQDLFEWVMSTAPKGHPKYAPNEVNNLD